jgi:hypothetical protein
VNVIYTLKKYNKSSFLVVERHSSVWNFGKVVSQYNRLIVSFKSDANADEGLYFAGRVDQVSLSAGNPCKPNNPCENGGVCYETFDTPEFYVCHCPRGFTGKHCSCVDSPCSKVIYYLVYRNRIYIGMKIVNILPY